MTPTSAVCRMKRFLHSICPTCLLTLLIFLQTQLVSSMLEHMKTVPVYSPTADVQVDSDDFLDMLTYDRVFWPEFLVLMQDNMVNHQSAELKALRFFFILVFPSGIVPRSDPL